MIDITVIYPRVDYKGASLDPQLAEYGKSKTFNREVAGGRNDNHTLELIFAGMNAGSCQEYPWFLESRARSMSVGDVVALWKSTDDKGAAWFICDSHGWLSVNATQAQSWLDFTREYGCCSFELRRWKMKHLSATFWAKRHCL